MHELRTSTGDISLSYSDHSKLKIKVNNRNKSNQMTNALLWYEYRGNYEGLKDNSWALLWFTYGHSLPEM